MSKRQFKPRKQKLTKTNKTSKRSSNFGQSFAKMFFLVVASLSTFYFIYDALIPKTNDTINDYITENLPHLLKLEWLLFCAIGAGFVYCAFKWLFKLSEKKYDFIVLGLVFIAINGLYAISFDKDIGSFGDNGQYVAHAKAMITHGGPYNVFSPKEKYKAKAPIGFPLMLAPITTIFGIDAIVKMKGFVFLLGSLSIIFYFLAFKRKLNKYAAAIIAILIGTYPMIIYNTTYIMTEVPFIFWLSVSLFCATRLEDAKSLKQTIIWGVLAAFATYWVYLTRAVGIAAIGGLSAWLFFHIPWIQIIKKKKKLFDLPLYKFIGITALMGVLFLGWQLKNTANERKSIAKIEAQSEASIKENGEANKVKKSNQIALFLGSDFSKRFSTNLKKTNVLWGQQIMNRKLSRWYLSLGKSQKQLGKKGTIINKFTPRGKEKKKGEVGLKFFNFLLVISLVLGLIRRDIVAFIFLFLAAVTLAGTGTPMLVVYSRYFIVFAPFMVYLLGRSFYDIATFINSKREIPSIVQIGTLLSVLFFFAMFTNNLSGAAYNVQRQNAGDMYTLAFDNYIKSGQWMKKNIEGEVLVASRKPRLFYLFSDKKGVFTVTYMNQKYSKELEEKLIQKFTDQKIDYVILDAFSTASRKVLLPTIQNNPNQFKVVQSVGDKYSSYIVQFIP